MRPKYIFYLIVLVTGCSGVQESNTPIAWKSIEKDLQERFITTSDSVVIDLPEGDFMFKNPLLIDGKSSITIRGKGMDKTRLSFAMQESGAEAFKASNCTNLVLEDFTIEDAKGDNIKITDSYGVTIRRVKSQWTGEPKEENGSYAFYPVLCKQVLVENSFAIGASDAGIYVGQSDSVIIRDNIVYFNVAGIESENSRWVEVYGNEAYDNTGGILIFDMPGLTQNGHTTRVFKNNVYNNNYRNFAPAGNIVAAVPPGSGIMLLATRNIEIFENVIKDNRTFGVAVASYDLVSAINADEGSQLEGNIETAEQDETYDPYPNDVHVHHNVFDNGKWFPTTENDFGLLFLTKFPFNTPDVVWDGIVKEGDTYRMCLAENGDMSFANLDASNDFAGLSNDQSPYLCNEPIIPAIF